MVGFATALIAELAVPVIAERGSMTTFHPHHIAERYGLFTVIVLGESVTAATLAFQGALDDTDSPTLIGLAVAGIVIPFCLWWVYFDHEDNPRPDSARSSFIWGYGHYFVFAAAALRSHPGRPRIIAWAVNGASVLVVAIRSCRSRCTLPPPYWPAWCWC